VSPPVDPPPVDPPPVDPLSVVAQPADALVRPGAGALVLGPGRPAVQPVGVGRTVGPAVGAVVAGVVVTGVLRDGRGPATYAAGSSAPAARASALLDTSPRRRPSSR
jgi:hypothetical protein